MCGIGVGGWCLGVWGVVVGCEVERGSVWG